MSNGKKGAGAERREEITVFLVRGESSCGDCGAELDRRAMLTLRGEEPNRIALCLDCADLGHLEFLPRGDAALTRRAGKYSGLRAVVVEWNRRRRRYERQGILAEAAAIARAEDECLADAEVRERRNERRRERESELDAEFVTRFASEIRDCYPGCPAKVAKEIAAHACRKYSGRVGRSAAAKEFDPAAIRLAVRAHLRHVHTKYDRLLMAGWGRDEARAEIAAELDRAEAGWREQGRIGQWSAEAETRCKPRPNFQWREANPPLWSCRGSP